ncbi:peptide chain release factor N(5)-glutamine methyltransferase [Candidatus Falkowbacteria bacterium]|nr:peptide chain release factor N(5)-glutamine methyltransferase [Candidatus Falkowbacteria bacterium]
MKRPTIQQILDKDHLIIDDRFGSPQNDIEEILLWVTKWNYEQLLQHQNKRLSFTQYLRYILALGKRKRGMPIAYITGYKDFGGRRFMVNRHTLIPRADTLVVVEYARRFCVEHGITNIIEIGVGSGALITTLTLELHNPSMTFIGTDISQDTLKVARKNAKTHGASISFVYNNLLDNAENFIPSTKYIIISNPPYVATADLNEPSIAYEPKLALDGGADGMKYYEELLKQISTLTHKPEAVFFEIGFNQAQLISQLTKKYLPTADILIRKDLNSLDRVALIQMNPSQQH